VIENRIVLFLLPVALLLLWIVVRSLQGRKPTRFSINVAFSLLLLIYFAGAAGTGIFWVAAQELPIFDWHYLLGYIVFLLVIVHVVLNWKPVAAFFRARAPAGVKDDSGRAFRGWVKVTAATLLAAAVGGALFFAGGQYASEQIMVYLPAENDASRSADEESDEESGAGSDAESDAGSPAGSPAKPAGSTASTPRTSRLLVDADGEKITMAAFYNRGSSYPARTHLSGVTWKTRPPVYKEYPGRPETPLVDARPSGGGGLLEAAAAWRAGCHRLATSSMTLEELSLLLYHTQGVTAVRKLSFGDYEFRAAPSAGALYPVDLYLVANRVDGLRPGLYHYNVKAHSLVHVREGVHFPDLEAAAGCPHYYQPAAATVIVTVTFGRTGFKYKERAYRYVNMDAGHAVYNLCAAAAARGMAAPVVARFDDAALNAFLDVDAGRSAALLLIPLGRPLAGGGSPPLPEPCFAVDLKAASGRKVVTFSSAIHEASSFRRAGGWGSPPRFRKRTSAQSMPGQSIPVQSTAADGDLSSGAGDAPILSLPEPAKGRDLFPAIRDRRSGREYSDAPMELEELTALCAAAQGAPGVPEVAVESGKPGTSGALDAPDTPGAGDPFLALSAPLDLHVVVRDVTGLEAGVYLYDRDRRSLRQKKLGDFSSEGHAASLSQDFCGTADVLFIKTVDWDALDRPDGDRGYRYACIRSGMVGEGLYLQAAALGLGVCGVGAFRDDDMAAVAGCDPAKTLVLYVTAVGR
jgi:SagB-type dehydrogenase family enzyme